LNLKCVNRAQPLGSKGEEKREAKSIHTNGDRDSPRGGALS